MRTFTPKLPQILTLSLLVGIFSAYNPVFAETTETKAADVHQHPQNTTDWPGIYNGFLPCADCIGIKTTLALNKNNTYILISQYAGKSEREFVEKGKFTWSNDNSSILLTPRNGTTTQQYAVDENKLTQLDSNGKRITGKLADRYSLRRTDVTDKQTSHAH